MGGRDLRFLLAQIGECIEHETSLLAQGRPSGFDEIVARKQRGLMDLWSALGGDRPELHGGDRDALADLRRKLDENARRLGAHVRASREIAAVLREVAREAASDGTYSPRPAQRR